MSTEKSFAIEILRQYGDELRAESLLVVRASEYDILEAQNKRLREGLERVVSDFETDYVLDGVVVDDPATTHRMAWEIARAALDAK